jgi:hypothetical protein
MGSPHALDWNVGDTVLPQTAKIAIHATAATKKRANRNGKPFRLNN